MSKMNKQLIKAGLFYLINKDKKSFIDRLSLYLQDREKLIDFLFEGAIPINEEVKRELEEYIKTSIPCPEYFHGIIDIDIDFDYSFNQQYKVTYKVDRFYDNDQSPWRGQESQDDVHPVKMITEIETTIYPRDIKM